MRPPHRAQAQQARRGHRHRQLRDREGARRLRRRLATDDSARRRSGRGVRRLAPRPPPGSTAPPATGPATGPATAGDTGDPQARTCGTGCSSRRCSRSRSSCSRWCRALAVRLLAVALPHPRGTCGRVGRLPLPPRRLGQPPARRDHDGHPGLPRHAGRFRLVALRVVPRHRRRDRHDPPVRADDPTQGRCEQPLPRGRRRGDHVPAGRSLAGDARQAAGRGGAARADAGGRQGRRRAARRRRAAGAGRRPCGRRPLRRTPWRDHRRRRCRHRGHLRRRLLDAHR